MESKQGGQIGSWQRGVPFSGQWHGAAVLAVAGDETRALSARHYTRMPLGNRERRVQWRVTRYAGFRLPDWDLEMALISSIKNSSDIAIATGALVIQSQTSLITYYFLYIVE